MKRLPYLFCLTAIIVLVFLTVAGSAKAQEIPDYLTVTKSNSEIVPGEVIVKYKKDQSPSDLREKVQTRKDRSRSFFGAMQNTAENFMYRIQSEEQPEEQLMELQQVVRSVGVTEIQELFQDTPTPSDDKLEDIEVIKTQEILSVKELIKAYENLGNVEYVEPNYIRALRATPNDELYPQMWSLRKIQMEQAWDITKGSKNVIVAVIDGGVDYTHPDLPDNIIKGHNYIANDDDPMDDTSSSHGTHVAGTIGAATSNKIGITGINWQVQLLAIKVMDAEGRGRDTDIVSGIREAADKGAKIINISLGGKGACPRTWQDTINYATEKGALVVGATGEGDKIENVDVELDTPTSCKGVFSVAATGPTDQRASYSFYGNTISIAAPGGDIDANCHDFNSCSTSWIVSTGKNGTWKLLIGTSMATPHVSGVAALLFAAKPDLTPDQVKSLLQTTGDSINTDHPIGKRLNAYKALQQITSISPSINPPTNTPIPPTPTHLQKKGDVNGDNVVNIQDFTIWRCEVQGNGICNNPPSNKRADLNKDSKVDLLDYILWINDFIR